MPSFPLIKDLPAELDTSGWQWAPFDAPNGQSDGFWLGIDRDGNTWLTKLKGDDLAYREMVFARLAQKMGWSCQSSAFLRFDQQSADFLGISTSEAHAAHWFMAEHESAPCSAECKCKPLIGRTKINIRDLHDCGIAYILDWPKSDFAACLFGAYEPSDHLFTATHEFVIIDSERMFSSRPRSFMNEPAWWSDPDGPTLALEVCREYLALTTADIEAALTAPSGIPDQYRERIAFLLNESRQLAMAFIAPNSRN